MIAYASNTGTLRNLAALRAAQWRIFLTPLNPKPRDGIRFAIDNGAWSCFQRGTPFDEKGFSGLVERLGAAADFVIAPDIVAGGAASLKFSRSWMRALRNMRLVLLPIQDGMSAEAVGAFLREYPNAGLFLGGSTEYKLREMYAWGLVANSFGRWYHVGRVNTRRRIRLCEEAGAHSFDGTSATRFCSTLPRLDDARRQPQLFTVRAELTA